MRLETFLKYLVPFSFFLWSCIANAQCPPSAADWMEYIIHVENSTAHPEKKIEELHTLQSLFLQCNTKKDSLYARIVHRLGAFYSHIGDFEKAINLTKEAITINKSNFPGSQPSFLANSYYNLGLFYNQLLILDDSYSYFDSCMQIGRIYPDKSFLALLALEQNAFTYFETGDYQKSIEAANYGIVLAKEAKDTVLEASLLLQKAQAQLELNLIDNAEKTIEKTLQILTKSFITKDLQATGYTVYAHFLTKKKLYDDAVSYYLKALQLNLELEFWPRCARNMNDLGLLYDEELNAPEKAIAAYKKGIKILEKKISAPYQLSGMYINTGMVYWRQQDYRKALYYYQKGLTVLPIEFKDTLLQNNPSSSKLKLVSNDHFVSILLSNKGESFLELYKAEKNEDYLLYALDAFKAASNMVDQMRWKQHSQQSKLFWREKTKAMYGNAIETCYLLNDHENAFFFFEKSRAVLLNDKLSELGAKKYLSQEGLAREQELRIKLFSLQQQLPSLTENTPAYNDVRQQLFATQETLEKFIKNLENTNPAYYQYKYDTISPTIGDIRTQLLKSEHSLVEYFHGESAIYMLAIMPDTTLLMRSNFDSYNTTARELLRLTSDKLTLNKNYSRYRQLAYTLYDSLFKPLRIHTKKVIVSPDDHFIPFEILLTDPDNPSSFLLQDYAFSYTYSADYLLKSNQEQLSADHTLLGIAPVTYHPFLQQQPLHGADFSLENIKSYFSSVQFLTKESATKQQFLNSLPLYTIVHLYSHADADSTGNEPILYLYDSTLNISELQMLGNLPIQLIVLSACNTGVGKNVRGEGVFSLARGFAAAGIPSSITTLWQIDNQSTYQLTEIFYKYFSQGLPLDEALQKAKLEFLHVYDKAYELPYFWAASILIGRTDITMYERVNNSSSTSYMITGSILFICIISALVFYRKKHLQK